MADITICMSKFCPLKDGCYRSQANPSEYRQSYCDFSNRVTDGDGGYKCSEFIRVAAEQNETSTIP